MNVLEAAYKRDMDHNYLVLTAEEKIYGGSYQVRMIVTNTIPGLMKCNIRSVDNVVYFYYEITSKQPIARVFEMNSITYDVLIKILVGVKKALEGIKEYLLEADHLLLDPAHIYMDVESKEAAFCYYPSDKNKIEKSFHLFSEYILNKLDHNDRKAVVCGYEIYKNTLEENYNMDQIMEILHKNSNCNEELDAYKSAPMQGQTGCFGAVKADLFKEAPVPLRGDRSDMEPQSRKKKNVVEQKKGKREFKVDKVLKMLGLLVIPGCLVVLIYQLFFEILAVASVSTTQIGGVIFLVAGVTAYYVSEKKNKRKNDNGLDNYKKAGMKKEEHKEVVKRRGIIEKVSCIKESLKKSNYKEDVIKKWEDKSEVYGDKALREGGNRSITLHDMSQNQQTRSIISPDDNKRSMEDIATRQAVNEERKEPFGETSLLISQEHKGIMRLESQRPREYPDIEINKEILTIGKLENMSDVIINNATISRIHARIDINAEGVFMTDLNSTNGTYANGIMFKANERKKVQDGDRIGFSNLTYILKMH